MKLHTLAFAALILMGSSMVAHAQILTISITNLTQGMYFTPRLVIAHNDTVDAFEPGINASSALAWLAEAGVIDDAQNAASSGQNFEALLGPASTDNGSNRWQRFGGLLAPATTSSNYSFDDGDYEYLSILSMLVPTNDAFLGLDSIRIPTEPGTYTYNVNAYDAGSEANDEINPAANNGADGSSRTITEAGTGNALGDYGVPGMAAPPPTQANLQTDSTATGVAIQIDGSNQLEDATDGPVHIHRNVLGDTSSNAGASDLDSRIHRWLNPVARITITVPAS